MKRFAAILSALMILVATTGVPMVTHHCMVKGEDTWITTAPDYKCCGSQEHMGIGCCSNEFDLKKVDDSFLTFNITTDLLPEFVVAFVQTFIFQDVPLVLKNNILPTNNPDPPPVKEDIPVFVQVFRL